MGTNKNDNLTKCQLRGCTIVLVGSIGRFTNYVNCEKLRPNLAVQNENGSIISANIGGCVCFWYLLSKKYSKHYDYRYSSLGLTSVFVFNYRKWLHLPIMVTLNGLHIANMKTKLVIPLFNIFMPQLWT